MNDLIKQIKELNSQIRTKKKELKDSFEIELLKLLLENPELKNVTAYVNNHEFNDGDATNYSFYYDSLTLNFKDGTEYDDCSKKDSVKELIREKFVQFFGLFDVDNFYEFAYSDWYQDVAFSVKNDKLIIE